MSLTPETISKRIQEATRPRFRTQLAARGLARNLIWNAGKLPPGSPSFSVTLSSDLISYGLGLFNLGLRLRRVDKSNPMANRAFERAAEAIESVIRDGDPLWNERGFYTVIAASAYHLGHFSARAFSILPSANDAQNLSPAERTLVSLMRRDISALKLSILDWVTPNGSFDDTLAAM